MGMLGQGAALAAPRMACPLVCALSVLCCSLLPGLVHAGGFSVSPVRLFFSEKDRAVALRLSNDGEQTLSLVTDVQAWTQDEHGRDRLEASDDLIVSPTALRIGPGKEQVVRLILAVPRDPARQMTYRLFLREQVQAGHGAGGQGSGGQGSGAPRVPIALALSLPVFITPPRARHDLHCAMDGGSSHEPVAWCENRGLAHARLGRLDLIEDGSLSARHEGSVYVLAGTRTALRLAGTTLGPQGQTRVLRALLDEQETLQWVQPRMRTVNPGEQQTAARKVDNEVDR